MRKLLSVTFKVVWNDVNDKCECGNCVEKRDRKNVVISFALRDILNLRNTCFHCLMTRWDSKCYVCFRQFPKWLKANISCLILRNKFVWNSRIMAVSMVISDFFPTRWKFPKMTNSTTLMVCKYFHSKRILLYCNTISPARNSFAFGKQKTLFFF